MIITDLSIHAPREGGDLIVIPALSGGIELSIHAPREGGDSKPVQK